MQPVALWECCNVRRSEEGNAVKSGLLVASPQLHDPLFERTVILLAEYGAHGALGFVINRPTPLTLETVLEHLEIEHTQPFADGVCWGGPVQANAGFLIYREPSSNNPYLRDETVVEILPGICISSSRFALEGIVRGRITRPFCLCLGYAGWDAEQLDQEIQRGSWIVLDFDERLIFEVPLEKRWEQAIASLGLQTEQLWMTGVVDE